MSAVVAGVLGIAIILLIIGLGWHAVWNGITEGAVTVKNVIIQVINYSSSEAQFGAGSQNNTEHDPFGSNNSHGRGLNKA